MENLPGHLKVQLINMPPADKCHSNGFRLQVASFTVLLLTEELGNAYCFFSVSPNILPFLCLPFGRGNFNGADCVDDVYNCTTFWLMAKEKFH